MEKFVQPSANLFKEPDSNAVFIIEFKIDNPPETKFSARYPNQNEKNHLTLENVVKNNYVEKSRDIYECIHSCKVLDNLVSVKRNAGPLCDISQLYESFAYNPHWKSKIDKVKKSFGIKSMRNIRGDGNCYYRAIAFAYFEKIVSMGKETIWDLMNFLKSEKGPYFSFKTEFGSNAVQINLRYVFAKFADAYNTHTREDVLKMFFEEYLTNEEFDLNCIKYMRCCIAAFWRFHPDMEFNGIKLEWMLNGMPLDKFLKAEILEMGKEASNMILCILPILLRINVRTILVDVNEADDLINETLFPSKLAEIEIVYDEDGLNFHEDTIHILLKPGHYDLLYKDTVSYDAAYYKVLKELIEFQQDLHTYKITLIKKEYGIYNIITL